MALMHLRINAHTLTTSSHKRQLHTQRKFIKPRKRCKATDHSEPPVTVLPGCSQLSTTHPEAKSRLADRAVTEASPGRLIWAAAEASPGRLPWTAASVSTPRTTVEAIPGRLVRASAGAIPGRLIRTFAGAVPGRLVRAASVEAIPGRVV